MTIARVLDGLEEIMAPNEAAALLDIAGRMIQRRRHRYARWLDDERRIA